MKFTKLFSEILEINYDPKEGFVDVSIEFYSPHIAVEWVELILKEINEEMRSEEKKEAQASIDYITNTLAKVDNTSIQSSLYQLIEEQTKVLMLTSAREEYVFKTISPALVPEKKSKPSRVLIGHCGWRHRWLFIGIVDTHTVLYP